MASLSAHSDWQTFEYGLIIDSVDGHPTEEVRYLLPNTNVRYSKALNLAAYTCTTSIDCSDTVAEVIYPIIHKLTGKENVDFSIVKARIDLHDFRDNITDIVDETAAITDFFSVEYSSRQVEYSIRSHRSLDRGRVDCLPG